MGQDGSPGQQGQRTPSEIAPPDALTSGPRRIHWPDTNPTEETGELDQLHIQNFLSTLADIALSETRRKLDRESDGAT